VKSPIILSLPSGLDTHFVAYFALFITAVLLWTVICGKLLQLTLKLPVIAGEIIGGIILGPSVINIARFSLFTHPLSIVDQASQTLYGIVSSDIFVFVIVLISAVLTVSYLLWIAGHETDIQDLVRVGTTAVIAGILGALVPIIMTIGVSYIVWPDSFSLIRSLGMGLVFAATSVSIPVAMLVSQKKMHLKSSKATLGAAIIDDIFAVILLSLFFIALGAGVLGSAEGITTLVATGTTGASSLAYALGSMVISFIAMFLAGYYIVPVILNFLKRHNLDYLYPIVATVCMLGYFAFSELLGGLAGITGAYFAGLFHRRGDERHHAHRALSPFVNSFLLPLFLGSIGLQIDISVLHRGQWGIVFLLLLSAIISKFIGCFLATAVDNYVGYVSGSGSGQRWTWLETYIFGASMVARGEVGLVVATILNGTGILTPEQYIMSIVVIILTTITTPIMLAYGFSLADTQKTKVINQSDEQFELIFTTSQFKIFDAGQLFEMITGKLEAEHLLKASADMSTGGQFIDVRTYDVRILLFPDRGIVLRGRQESVQELVNVIRESIIADAEHFTMTF